MENPMVDVNATSPRKLKLSRLPDRMSAKIHVKVPPDLKQQLLAYAELYRETYGEEETIEALVPYMLSAFLRGDRALPLRTRRPRPPRRTTRTPTGTPSAT
jgi:hypothetical protein